MKLRHLFVAAIVALGFVACQNDKAISNDVKSNTIEFRTLTSNQKRAQQRVAATTSTSIADFRVYANHNGDAIENLDGFYIKGIEIVKNGTIWDYANPEEKTAWPSFETRDALDFYSISPATYSLSVKTSSLSIDNFVTNEDAKDQVDLLYAVNLNEACEAGNRTSAVAVKFEHALSQIAFNVVKTAACPYGEIRVNAARLVAIYPNGTFTLPLGVNTDIDGAVVDATYENWKLEAAARDTAKHYAAIINKDQAVTTTATAVTTVDGNLFVIPQNIKGWARETDKTNTALGAYILVDCNVRDNDGSYIWGDAYQYETVAVPVPANTVEGNVVWQPGVKYYYTLNFGKGIGFYPPTHETKPGEPVIGNYIDFEVEVDTFAEGSDDEVLFY